AVRAAAAAAVIATSCARGPGAHEAVARGEYLVTIVGCHACHTPMVRGSEGFELDRRHLLAGHPETMPIAASTDVCAPIDATTAFRGPVGVSDAPHPRPGR